METNKGVEQQEFGTKMLDGILETVAVRCDIEA